MKWFDETIWYGRRHHMIVIGFFCYWQHPTWREVLRSSVCGSWGWFTSGHKSSKCHLGLKRFLFTFLPQLCFTFPFANWRHANSSQCELPSFFFFFKLRPWPSETLIPHLSVLRNLILVPDIIVPILVRALPWVPFYRDQKMKSLSFQVSLTFWL